MSKSEFLKKILAVGLSVMSCMPAVGANGSNNEEPLKVQIKKESKENYSFIKKALIGSIVAILTGLGVYKFFVSENTEKHDNEEPRPKESNTQNQNSGNPEQAEVNTTTNEKPEPKKREILDQNKEKPEKKDTPNQDEEKQKPEKKDTPNQDEEKSKSEGKDTPSQDNKELRLERKHVPNNDAYFQSWSDLALKQVSILYGQKKIREYVENSSDTNPYIETLKYVFKVLRGKEKCDERLFKDKLEQLGFNLSGNKKYVDKNIDTLTSRCSFGLSLFGDEQNSIADFIKFYDRDSNGNLSSKDGFSVLCYVNENTIKEFEKFSLDNGKEYELTVCIFHSRTGWDVMIKQENGEWHKYCLNGRYKVISKEKVKDMLCNPPSEFFKLVYSIK